MKYMLTSLAAVSGLLLNTWWLHSPYLGVPLVVLLFLLSSYRVGQSLPKRITAYRLFWGSSLLLLALMLIGTVTYYSVGITPLSSTILLLLTFIPYTLTKKEDIPCENAKPANRVADLLGVITVACLVILFTTIIRARTGDLLVSPWQVVEPWFFIVYSVGIASLLWHNNVSVSSLRSRILTSAYLFFAFSIAAIVFAHGFGFDGFIHRATELWIAEHGFIDPKTPYYIGQYSVVVFFHLITGLSIQLIDIFMIPFLAAVLLPSVFGYTLSAVKIHERYGISLSLLVPFLYYITLNLTTPHNLVLLLFILTVMALFAHSKKVLPWWITSMMATAALFTHPLLGAPLWLFHIYVLLTIHSQSKRRRVAYHLAFLSGASLLPSVMFSLNNYLGGFGLPELINPFSQIKKITSLFDRPYWFADTPYPLLEGLYDYQLLITPLFLAGALLGLWLVRKERYTWTLVVASLSFVIGGALLRTWLFFPNVAEAEQNNYPLRLFWASVLFLLPLAAVGVHKSILWLKEQRALSFFLVPLSVMLMFSFYFSYPQRNQKIFYPGYNVSDADVITAKWIHDKQGADDNYIVLANSLTSIAALTEYSFYKNYQTEEGELFYYAIPTGGPLYKFYQEMLYEDQERSTMDTAMELTGASTSYFAISYFWKDHDDIVEGAKKSADEWHLLADGRMHLFIYHRDTEE